MTGASNTARLTWFTHIESDVCTGRAGRALCCTLRESRGSRPIFLCSVSFEWPQSLMPSSLDRPRLLSLAPCPNAHTALTDARPFVFGRAFGRPPCTARLGDASGREPSGRCARHRRSWPRTSRRGRLLSFSDLGSTRPVWVNNTTVALPIAVASRRRALTLAHRLWLGSLDRIALRSL